ncbi:MAG: hypothetical protein Q8O76_08435 [Chloroflexota bacterium]|nr:hypothetical protein [Chloroflexota bacterium]
METCQFCGSENIGPTPAEDEFYCKSCGRLHHPTMEQHRFTAGAQTECYDITEEPDGSAILWVNFGCGTGPIQVEQSRWFVLGEKWTRWRSHSRHPNREAAEACKRGLEHDMDGPS